MCKKFNFLDSIALALVIIGGLNWGLVGALNFDLVAWIFGITIISTIVYILVGLSAIYMLISLPKFKGGCNCCAKPDQVQ